MPSTEERLITQLERTNKLIDRIENQRYLQMIDRPWRFLAMSFMQGVAVALGSTLGLAIIVYTLVFTLHRLEVFAPFSAEVNHVLQVLEKISNK